LKVLTPRRCSWACRFLAETLHWTIYWPGFRCVY